MRLKAIAVLAFAALAACDGPLATPAAEPPDEPSRSLTTINWQGYTWNVKNGTGLGPGPNNWSSNNVWVDANGYLHLKISKVNNVWYAAEIGTQQNLGFGTYQFWVEGRIDQLDPNVVLGLFGYAGPDGTNEIDIEFSRWGDPNWPNASYTVWPASSSYTSAVDTFRLSLEGTFTTQRYKWQSTSVFFQTIGGHYDTNTNVIHSWTYAPSSNATQRIPQNSMPARINLWLMNGSAPTNGQEVEIVIRKFTFTPL